MTQKTTKRKISLEVVTGGMISLSDVVDQMDGQSVTIDGNEFCLGQLVSAKSGNTNLKLDK